MRRKALIIYCDNTASGRLNGPTVDNTNYRSFLKSNLGGNWEDGEIKSLSNPSSVDVVFEIFSTLSGFDYTFIIFTGHGFINVNDQLQYVELSDKSISIRSLKTNAKKQTLIIDACRGYYQPLNEEIQKSFSLESFRNAIGDGGSTRKIFDEAVNNANEGWSILYAANKNETALDTNLGAAYLSSLIKVSKYWKETDMSNSILNLKEAHELASVFIKDNYNTIQVPTMEQEKRNSHFPFAVKHSFIHK